MIKNQYPVQLEIAGPLAIFTRPDTGGTPTSFPIPTWSASKGLFESIAFFSDGTAYICPIRVEVCRRVGEPGGDIRFQRYTTNYGGPQRKASLFGKGITLGGSSMQLFATVLSNVCYRLHGLILGECRSGQINARHYLQDLFNRRLRRGECFRTPCLGWSEFTCSYWGPFREHLTEVDDALNLEVPSMLASVWDSPTQGSYSPVYRQDVRIERGVLKYSVPFDLHAKGAAEAGNA